MISSLYAPRSLRRAALWRSFQRHLPFAFPQIASKILAPFLKPRTDRS